jgi:hypothetical protein
MQGRSFEQCVEAVAAAGKIGSKRALDLLSQVNDRAEEMRRSGTADPYLAAASELADKQVKEAQQARLDAVRNATVRAEMVSRAEAEAEGRIAPGISANLLPGKKALTLADGLRSILHWVPGADRKDNVESMWVGLSRQLISPIGNRLRQLGLEKAAVSDGLRNEVAESMWRMNGGMPNSEITISKPAQQIAEAFMGPLKLIKERQNAAGANIGDAVDYVTHTTWSPRQLRRAAGPGADREAAFQAWKERDVPRMADKTFEGIIPREGETAEAAKERFIRSVYDATESGVHMRGTALGSFTAEGDGFIPPVYEGTSNIARRASQQRVVYWKNAQAWADHMNEFGGGQSLYHNVVHALDVGARRTALMHYLGTNPAANFETVVQRMIEKNRTSDELGRLQNQIEGVRNVLGRLDGSLNVPIHEDAGVLTNNLMSAEAITHLGGVSLTHLSAAPGTFSSEMVHHGVSRFETMGNIVKALTMHRGGAEAQEALADAGAYAHGYTLALQRAGTMREVYQRDGFPGFVSWASAHFMRLTGLPQILDSLQAQAVKSVLMARLGRQSHLDFAEIEPHQQAALKGYGVGPEEWRLIRGAQTPSMVEGRRWLVPSDAIHSDPAAVEALLRARGEIGEKATQATIDKAVKAFQWELGDKLLMYLNDAGDRGAVRPGVRERAIVLRNLRPGDPWHFLARAVAQFKMWPLAAFNQILGRDIAMSLNKREIATNIGVMLALSAVGGAMRMSVNDLANGRPQRDFRNPLTLLAALAQGGGLGIYGDFLFGETSRMSTGLASTLGGPIAGDTEKLWNLFERFKTDLKDQPGKALQHMWPDLAHLGVQHVPFANLIYLKGALDYLLWYHLFEAASPGWWERTNRRLVKEQGRGMVGYRPGAKIPYTPFAFGH